MGQDSPTTEQVSWQRYPWSLELPQQNLGLRMYLNLEERNQKNCSFEAAASHGGSGLRTRAVELGRPGLLLYSSLGLHFLTCKMG